MHELPHDNVWVRLAPSPIHGVGAFAIRRIPAGTNVFSNDGGAIVWMDATETATLPLPLKRLYEDFAIRKGDRIGCPLNFNIMGVGWYVNEPRHGHSPNLTIGEDYKMIANRDVDQGEELTISYRTFSR